MTDLQAKHKVLRILYSSYEMRVRLFYRKVGLEVVAGKSLHTAIGTRYFIALIDRRHINPSIIGFGETEAKAWENAARRKDLV